jgi:nitroreductase
MASAIVMSHDTQEALVREAMRAPSVHNVQPARWRFEPGGDLVLFRAIGRELPVADPTGHDLRASLGAAFEGMTLALSRMGLALADVRVETETLADGCVPVLRARLTAAAAPDPLAEFVSVRRSYRGNFLPATDATRHAIAALARDDARILADPAQIARIAKLHDVATWHFESQRAYHAELWSWLRLDPSDPLYKRDGLNADCLALSSAERVGARLALRPPVFRLLSALGVARSLVSESAQVKSAAAVILFAPLASLDAFDVGRSFYRLWLEITRAGLHAAPMSATADHAPAREALARAHELPYDRRIANVLRVGRAPGGRVAESPRLPVREFIV